MKRKRINWTNSPTNFAVIVIEISPDCVVFRLIENGTLVNKHNVNALRQNLLASAHSLVNKLSVVDYITGVMNNTDQLTMGGMRMSTTVMGGASFQSFVRSDQRSYSCPFIDHANGTYDIVCRLYDTCNTINIKLSYVDFGAFRQNGKYIGSTVFNERFCTKTDISHFYRGTYVGWYKSNATVPWRWLRGSKEIMTDDAARSCIAQLPSTVLLFGDSHLLYTFYHWLKLIDRLKPEMALQRHFKSWYVDKFSMTRVTFIMEDTRTLSEK